MAAVYFSCRSISTDTHNNGMDAVFVGFYFISEAVNIWHRNSRHYYMMKNEIDSKFTKLFSTRSNIALNRIHISRCIQSNRTKPIYLNLTKRITLHTENSILFSSPLSASFSTNTHTYTLTIFHQFKTIPHYIHAFIQVAKR